MANSPAKPPVALFRTGDIIGRYRIESLHGIPREREIWIHYRVSHLTDGRNYFLKTLSAEVSLEKAFVTRMRGEATLMARLKHKNIMGLVECIEGPAQVHLVLDFVEGETLQTRVDAQTRRDRARIVGVTNIVSQILQGLAHIHQAGLVHRSLEPANIVLAKDGEAMITGFGLMCEAARQDGTDPDPASLPSRRPQADIFAVGCMTYYILTGDTPTGLAQPASRLVSGLAPQWDDFIARCVAEDPGKRYQNGAEALEAFRQLETQTVRGSAKSWISAARRWLGLK